jgi:hypothetical protein
MGTWSWMHSGSSACEDLDTNSVIVAPSSVSSITPEPVPHLAQLRPESSQRRQLVATPSANCVASRRSVAALPSLAAARISQL